MRPDGIRDGTLRERGWALISVLWVMAILTMLVAAAQALSYGSAQREQRALTDAEIGAALDAGVVRAVIGISDPRPAERWRVDGVAQEFALGGQTIRVAVQDELGRIDLNAADGALLGQLLRSAGLDKDAADALVGNILDWRGVGGDFQNLHAASPADYARAGRSYQPRHGPFQSVEELRLVLGMTPGLFARLRPALTIYSRHPAIDTGTASREALLAYYPDQPERVDQLLAARATTGSQGGVGGQPGTLPDVSNLAGRTFDVTVALELNHIVRRREAVVMLTNAPDRPFLVMAWQ